MVISELQNDKKHLTKVILSNNEEFLIDNDICVDKMLSKGMELDEEFINELIEDSDYKRAKSRAKRGIRILTMQH